MSLENIISEFFGSNPFIVSVDLFGSYAEGRATDKSDVDIAVLFEYGHIPSPLDMIGKKEDLEDLIKKEVDLIVLNDSSPILGMQVAKNCKNILMKKPKIYADYQMRLFTDYAELKELRLPMEKGMLKRKVL